MAQIDFTDEHLELFPTPVLRRAMSGLDGLNARLVELALEHEAADGGLVRSNVGGWHSADTFLQQDDPAVVVLRELLQRAVHDWVAWTSGRDPETFELTVALQGWAMVARRGHYARPHVHPSTHLALVYYADAGDPPSDAGPEAFSGRLELLDPRNRPQMLDLPGIPVRDSLGVTPVSGGLIAFPAWLYHYVHPYQGVRPRVSIACNAHVRGLRERREAP